MNRDRKRPAESSDAAREQVPAVLTQIVARFGDDGLMTITVDGQVLCDAPLGPDQLGSTIASIAERFRSPVRVEIHETDGTIWADILTPPAIDTANVESSAAESGSFSVTYEGFTPGEEILIAEITQTVIADQDGAVRLLAQRHPGRHKDVMVFGTVSGTTIASGLA
ncbi:MAG: hypothetical protein JWR83_3286 [Aeromicrobium sp.]|nr:hypothetical protein [Aeromicrobium sp.]